MKIPETAQKQTEDIAIGSGYMYIKEYEKGSAILRHGLRDDPVSRL